MSNDSNASLGSGAVPGTGIAGSRQMVDHHGRLTIFPRRSLACAALFAVLLPLACSGDDHPAICRDICDCVQDHGGDKNKCFELCEGVLADPSSTADDCREGLSSNGFASCTDRCIALAPKPSGNGGQGGAGASAIHGSGGGAGTGNPSTDQSCTVRVATGSHKECDWALCGGFSDPDICCSDVTDYEDRAGMKCGSTCVDATSDANNCGACGKACAAAERCAASTCQLRTPPSEGAGGKAGLGGSSSGGRAGGAGSSGSGASGGVAGPTYGISPGTYCWDIVAIAPGYTDGCQFDIETTVSTSAKRYALPVTYYNVAATLPDGTAIPRGTIEVGTDGSLGRAVVLNNTWGTLYSGPDTFTLPAPNQACSWTESATSTLTLTADNVFSISLSYQLSQFTGAATCAAAQSPVPAGGTCTSTWTWTVSIENPQVLATANGCQ